MKNLIIIASVVIGTLNGLAPNSLIKPNVSTTNTNEHSFNNSTLDLIDRN